MDYAYADAASFSLRPYSLLLSTNTIIMFTGQNHWHQSIRNLNACVHV